MAIRERLLGFDPAEHPVALQLGGSDPRLLAMAARMGAERGYDEINLNVGCPSDRVQSGRFGACLMAEPELVADCMRAMQEAVHGAGDRQVPHRRRRPRRLRVLRAFRRPRCVRAGVDVFVVHARKAHLQGLSPKENREVPPLRYDVPARLKSEHPDLTVILNGGIKSQAQVREWLPHFDGVMLGPAGLPGALPAGATRRRVARSGRASCPHANECSRLCRLRRAHAAGGTQAPVAVASRARDLCGITASPLLAALRHRAGTAPGRRRRGPARFAAHVPQCGMPRPETMAAGGADAG